MLSKNTGCTASIPPNLTFKTGSYLETDSKATSDLTVPYSGDPTWTKSIDDVLQYWINYNNCNTSPITTNITNTNLWDNSTVDHIVYNNGDNNVTTEHFKVLGGGHDWPGAWGNMDIDASQTLWEFFNYFKLEYTIGDLDYSGTINIFDMLLVSDGISDNNFSFLFDYNNDDSIDFNDIYAILSFILGY